MLPSLAAASESNEMGRRPKPPRRGNTRTRKGTRARARRDGKGKRPSNSGRERIEMHVAAAEPPAFGFIQSDHWPRLQISRALMDELSTFNAKFMKEQLRPEIVKAIIGPSPVRPKTIL